MMRTFLLILAIALVTAILRLLPVYLLGRKGKSLPRPILFLSTAMPGAIIGLLVIYSLRATAVLHPPFGFPALAGVAIAALLQQFKKNTLLSVSVSTAVYMVLIRVL